MNARANIINHNPKEQKIDVVNLNDRCPSSCAVLQASQSAAISIAAEAQALFQGFLQCLHNINPQNQLSPMEKKGANMLSHFTNKLDQAVANHFADNQHCIATQQDSSCPQKEKNELERKYLALEVKYKMLQHEQQQTQLKLDKFKSELSKKRTQFHNRILVQVFKDHFLPQAANKNSFFDIISREQLGQFIPFIRNILIGPALSEQLDSDLTQALAPYLDQDGTIDMDSWDAIDEDQTIITIKQQLAQLLFERSERKSAFEGLLRRKSPVAEEKIPALKAVFSQMGNGYTTALAS